MGFNNFAEYQLADNMAKNPKNALDLLYGLWEYSIKNAKAEAAELQKIMDREGKGENWKHGTGGITLKSFVRKNMI